MSCEESKNSSSTENITNSLNHLGLLSKENADIVFGLRTEPTTGNFNTVIQGQ